MTVDELLALPVSVPLWPTVGQAFGLGRDSTYSLAKRGELPVPVLKLGSQYRVTRAALLEALGINARNGETGPATGPAIAITDSTLA